MTPQTTPARPSSSPGDAVPAYTELTLIMLGAQSLGAVLHRIAKIAQDLIPGADEVSITLIERDRARTVGFAGDHAAALDERQYNCGHGPCLDAALTGQTIATATATDTQYPQFSRQAHRSGIQQSLAVALPTVLGNTGAVTIYSRTSGPFSDETHDAAENFAQQAAITVTNAALYAGAIQEVAHLKQAMVFRAVIEQAKGMIMRDEGCTADEAFDVLRDSSSRAHLKLRDVAQALVTGPAGTPAPRPVKHR
jgi:GAF domain-containing protein